MTEEEKTARLAELAEEKVAVKAARLMALKSQSQSIGGRSISRPALSELNRMLAKINREIAALNAGSSISISYVVPK